MEKIYSEIISAYKLKKLYEWRERYSDKEYPYKVAINLLYDLLLVDKMWREIHNPLNYSILSLGNGNFQNFNEAHGYVLNRTDNIARKIIRSIITSEYKYRDLIAGLNWSSIRNRVLKAQNGDNKEVQEIELAYYLFTCGVELIYALLAFGFIGIDKESAYTYLTGSKMAGIDYNSYQSLLNSFGKASGIYYKPLPDLFRDPNISTSDRKLNLKSKNKISN